MIARARYFLAAILCQLIGVGAASTLTDAGFLGQPLSAVEKSEFFNWFHLAEVASRANAEGGSTVSYRPSGPRFHQQAAVEVKVDKSGVVQSMDLVLLRSFIESRPNGPFARDIAASFLRDTLPEAAAAQITTFGAELQFRGESSQLVLMGPSSSRPDLPDTPTPAYETYRGTRPRYEKNFSGIAWIMMNEHGPNGEVLRMKIRPLIER